MEMIVKKTAKSIRKLLLIGFLFASSTLLAQSNEDFDIYLYDLGAETVQQLTQIPGNGEYNPSFHPEGFAIVHDVVNDTIPSHDLYITYLSNGISQPLNGGDGGNDAAWSPDGLLIAFDRVNAVDFDPNIYFVPLFGSERILVRENGIDPSWSPDGTFIAFTDITDGSVKVVNIFTKDERTVAPFGMNPSWSPNGNYIAYSDGNNLFRTPVFINGNPLGPEEQITFDEGEIFSQQPAWTPNSLYLVFHSNRESTEEDPFDFNIWKVMADGSEDPMLVTGQEINGDFDPIVSDDGAYIAYSAFTNPEEEGGEEDESLIEVAQNFPNPFRNATSLAFNLKQDALVDISIYNFMGQLVKKVKQGKFTAGVHQVDWDGLDDQGVKVPSGQYFYMLKLGQHTETKKIIKIE